MNLITNTNWNTEQALPTDLDNYRNERFIADDYATVTFDYNGYKIAAIVNYRIELETTTEAGDYENPENVNVEATEVELELLEMFINDGEDFQVSPHHFQTLQNELLIDLKVQY